MGSARMAVRHLLLLHTMYHLANRHLPVSGTLMQVAWNLELQPLQQGMYPKSGSTHLLQVPTNAPACTNKSSTDRHCVVVGLPPKLWEGSACAQLGWNIYAAGKQTEIARSTPAHKASSS